jgi:hypothetical protein
MVYSNESSTQTSSQFDPVEHATVEASWGEVLTRDNNELLRTLGTMPVSQMIDTVNK